MRFDWKKPTVQMLGRWQPWHKGHTELFKRALELTGQVVIMVREVPSEGDANPHIDGKQDDNPFDFDQIHTEIVGALTDEGYSWQDDFLILEVPNIVDISYGRGVGYTFTEHDLGKEIHEISATKIREQLRKDGEL